MQNNNSEVNCESAIGQHLNTNPECDKTYADNNFRIIGQARSSFNFGVLESVYIETHNPVMCRQEVRFFIRTLHVKNGYLVLFSHSWGQLDASPIRPIISRVTASGYIFRLTF